MALFPLQPYLARTLLAASDHGCVLEVLDVISVLAANNALFSDNTDQRDASTEARRKFRHSSGDHLTILNTVRAFDEIVSTESKGGRRDWCRSNFVNERTLMEAQNIRDQLRTTCARVGIDWRSTKQDAEEPMLRSFAIGLYANAALLQPDGTYRQTIGHAVRLKTMNSFSLHVE